MIPGSDWLSDQELGDWGADCEQDNCVACRNHWAGSCLRARAIRMIRELCKEIDKQDRTCGCGREFTSADYAYFGGSHGYYTCPTCGHQYARTLGSPLEMVVPPRKELMPREVAL